MPKRSPTRIGASVLLASALATFTVVPGTDVSRAEVLTDDAVNLYNVATTKCLDIPGQGQGAAGGPVQQLACNFSASDDQRWSLELQGDRDGDPVYLVRNEKDGLCLDLPGVEGAAPGTRVSESACAAKGDNQLFSARRAPSDADDAVAGAFQLVHVESGLCLDVDGSRPGLDGAAIAVATCAEDDDHYWAPLRHDPRRAGDEEILDVVLLGDSYSAGNGARRILAPGVYAPDYVGPQGCFRSNSNWAAHYVRGLAARRDVTYTNAACSGAVTADLFEARDLDRRSPGTLQLAGELSPADPAAVTLVNREVARRAECPAPTAPDEFYRQENVTFAPGGAANPGVTVVAYECVAYVRPQLEAVTADTDIVLFTFGGNDGGFSTIVEECFLRARGPECEAAVDAAHAALPGMADRLVEAARTMRERQGLHSCARVVMVSYPYISLDRPDYSAGGYPAATEVRELGDAGDAEQQRFVAAVNAAVPGQGVFVDVKPAFAGREPEPAAAVENPRSLIWEFPTQGVAIPVEFYHPRPEGWEEYARVLSERSAFGAAAGPTGFPGSSSDQVCEPDSGEPEPQPTTSPTPQPTSTPTPTPTATGTASPSPSPSASPSTAPVTVTNPRANPPRDPRAVSRSGSARGTRRPAQATATPSASGARAHSGALAHTGAEVAGLATGSAALVSAGLVLFFTSRRR